MEEGFNLSPILIPLAALLVGWAIGFFDSNLRTSKKIKQAEESAQVAIREAENKVAAFKEKMDSTQAAPVTDDNPGLLRIKNDNGKLTLDLDGIRINQPILTSEQRKRLIELLNVTRPWLEGKPASPPSTKTTPPPAPLPESKPVISSPPRQNAQASAPQQMQVPKKKKDEPEAPPTSIVGQINLILQARIANTPISSRGVALLESSSGGVNVYVGANKYEGVEAVPDEEIKATIRAAIAEWENKFTPGLS
ncbi:MAG TPA: hypothetical protein DCX53_09365 [Anaerolineae bacterium]|nr:hypothetical protein [Anaerolineae bacterium]